MTKWTRLARMVVPLVAQGIAPTFAAAQGVAVSANVGWVNQYYFRGILQKTSSASAGLTLAAGGLSVGTWAADVGNGSEVDLFGSYVLEVGPLSASAGGTAYFYTGEFDDNYLEANLGSGIGPLSVALAVGQHDTDPQAATYWHLAVTAAREGLFATLGTFGGEEEFYAKEGKYGQAGYGFSAAELDFSASGIWSDEVLSGAQDANGDATGELTFVFGVSKTFSIR